MSETLIRQPLSFTGEQNTGARTAVAGPLLIQFEWWAWGVQENLCDRMPGRISAADTETPQVADDVPVSEILDVDREYRQMAGTDKLPRVAPNSFNPVGTAWLPVLHIQRRDRRYTAFYSNAAPAHPADASDDWVVIYRNDEVNHGRWTVITGRYNNLRGKRIIPGREFECAQYYSKLQ